MQKEEEERRGEEGEGGVMFPGGSKLNSRDTSMARHLWRAARPAQKGVWAAYRWIDSKSPIRHCLTKWMLMTIIHPQDREVETQRRFSRGGRDTGGSSRARDADDGGRNAASASTPDDAPESRHFARRSRSSMISSYRRRHSSRSHALDSLIHARGVSIGEGETAGRSFFKDAEEELPRAPRVPSSSARHSRGRNSHSHGRRASFSDDAMESLRSVDKEASTMGPRTRAAHARLAQLSEEVSSSSSSERSSDESSRRYSMAREHREGASQGAQEWAAASLGRRHHHHAEAASSAMIKAKTARAPAAKGSQADKWGIPEGRGEGVQITEYKSALRRDRASEKSGISSKESRGQIER